MKFRETVQEVLGDSISPNDLRTITLIHAIILLQVSYRWRWGDEWGDYSNEMPILMNMVGEVERLGMNETHPELDTTLKKFAYKWMHPHDPAYLRCRRLREHLNAAAMSTPRSNSIISPMLNRALAVLCKVSY